jgi:hypothetical protein
MDILNVPYGRKLEKKIKEIKIIYMAIKIYTHGYTWDGGHHLEMAQFLV